MRLSSVRKNSQGFTLIEVIIIMMIIGILSVIAAPSFLGLLNRAKVNDAVVKVRGALQEAQTEAIRRGKSCDVNLDTTNPANHKVTGSCLVTGPRTLDGVAMETNVIGKMDFNFRGHTVFKVAGSTAATGKIVLYKSDAPISDKKCVAISNGIGILRSGTYSGDIAPAAKITDGNCKASKSQ